MRTGASLLDWAETFLARPWRADLLGVLFLLVVTGTVILKLSIWDSWLARTDLLTAYIPFYTFLGEQLRGGSLPGWSPFQASGLRFAGDPQSGWMYAPAMVWYALLSPVAATKAMIATQLLIAALSSYAFARLLGLRVVASLVAAISFALGANVYHNTYCCTIWSQLATWIPLGLLGVELGVRPGPLRYRAGGWALAAIAISQMFAGWLGQGVYNGLLILGGYVIYRTLISPPGGRTPMRERLRVLLVTGGATLLLGLGLSAAGILPRIDAAQYSQISAGDYEAVEETNGDSGWHPEHLLRQIFDTNSTERGTPFWRETNRRYYVGGFAASLALVAPFVARRRFAVPFFTVAAAVILILVSKETPLHRLFYLLPRYQSLHEHSPFRLMGLFFFFPAILAAATVDSLHRWARHRWLLPAAALPPLVMFWVDDFVRTPNRKIGDPVLDAAIVVSLVMVAAAVVAWREQGLGPIRTERLFSVLRVVLLLGVLWDPVGRQLTEENLTTQPMPPRVEMAVNGALSDTDPGGAGEFLQQQLLASNAPFRYFGYDGRELRTAGDPGGQTYQGRVTYMHIQSLLVSARATRLGLYDIQGYNPVQFQGYVDYLLAMNQGVEQDYHDANVLRTGINSPLIDLLNVRYIVIPRELPPGRPDLLRLSQLYPTVFSSSRVRVLENPNTLPHAWIVHDTRVAPTDEALELLDSRAVDPLDTALIAEPIPDFIPGTAGDNDQVTFSGYKPNWIELTAQSDTGGLLILNEIDANGWQAYVNGDRVEIHTVNGLQRGVVLPAGISEVTFRYEPLSMRAGLAISLLTMVAIAIIGLVLLVSVTPIGRRLLGDDPHVATLRQPETSTARPTPERSD